MATAMQSKKRNGDLIVSIDSMCKTFQEGFDQYVCKLKTSIRSNNREKAQTVFMSALAVLTFAFPDPEGQSGDEDGMETEATKVRAEMHAEILNLRQEMLNNSSSVRSRLDSTASSLKRVERQAGRIEKQAARTEKQADGTEEQLKSLTVSVDGRLEKLSEETKTVKQNIRGLRKLQMFFTRSSQASQAAAAAGSSTPATSAATSGPPRDIRLRKQYDLATTSGKRVHDIRDVKLLPGGEMLMADWDNKCVMLHDTQGQHLQSHQCPHKPYRLAVMNSGSVTSTVVVSLPLENSLEILEISQGVIKHKNTIQTKKKYLALAATDNQTLAAGYRAGIDLVDLSGRVLRQISTSIQPWYMIATADGDLVCVTSKDTIARLKVATGQILYNVKVAQIADPRGITVSHDNSLLVTDCDARTLHLVTPQGGWVKQLWAVPGGPDDDDRLWSVSLDNGLPVKPPEFMVKRQSETERRKAYTLPLTDSSEGSDAEWTPACERPKVAVQKRLFKPPSKVKAQNASTKKWPGQTKKEKTKTKKERQGEEEEEEETHVYPFRKKRVTSFMSLIIPEDDDFLYCEECNMEYITDCPVHGPLKPVYDSKVPPNCKRGEDPAYCRKTLPPGLVIKKSKIPQAGLGVFARKFFPVRSRFGPYGGRREKDLYIAHESGYCWQVIHDGKPTHFVDASDPKESNWMRFVNCARSEEEQCVTAYQHQGEIYYRAHKDIHPGMELLVYYGDSYARDLGIQTQRVGGAKTMIKDQTSVQQHTDSDNPNGKGPFECFWCPYVYLQYVDRERHMKRSHSDEYAKVLQEKFSHHMKGSCQDNVLQSCRMNSLSHCEKPFYITPKRTSIETEASVDQDIISPSEQARQTFPPRNMSEKIFKDFCNPQRSEQNKKTCCKYNHLVMNKVSSPFSGLKHKCLEKEERYESNMCCKTSGNERELSVYQNIPTDKKSYEIDVAGKGFRDSSNFLKHKRTHTSDTCGKACRDSGDLSRHKRIHTGDKPYKCDVCGKAFSDSGNLSTHKRTHTGDKPYKCDLCGKAFGQSGTLSNHNRTHTGDKPYKCDVCGKACRDSGHLSNHKRTHTGDKPYKCDLCGKVFAKSFNLSKHKRTHTGDKPYRCDVCGKAFGHSHALSRHKRTHTGDKPYRCDVCGKAFGQSGDLSGHKRTHTGDKPYRCDVCGKAFGYSHALSRHERTHTGDKPYKCDVCGKAFSDSSDLSKHKRTHTGEKPYRCDVCGKAFSDSSDLSKHKRTHTK